MLTLNFFVAVHDETIIGYIYGYTHKCPDHLKGHEYIGHLEACYIEKEFRGKNIAKNLTIELLTWFKTQNITLVELGVYANNESKEVWRKLGFTDFHITMRKLL
jgi:ribosomal protein S18 acetylase RimI-like enzyme